MPIITSIAKHEPVVQIQIEGKQVPILIDTGATYTCVRLKNVSPHVRQICQKRGILGKTSDNKNDHSNLTNYGRRNSYITDLGI